MVSQLSCLVNQIIRIYRDAVPAPQARRVLVEVPLCARRLQHILGIQARLMEYERELIHQGDIDVPLDVLYDLRRLSCLDVPGDKDVVIDPYSSARRRVLSLSIPETILVILSMLCASSPGLIRSGE
jgi:hypothetical protein